MTELLEAHRLVTLTGPGGTGKTRLALHVAGEMAERFEGVFFVSLAPIFEAGLVAPRILTELGVPPSKEAPEDQLRSHLNDQGWLLVLDNFEQVIEAATLVADLLEGAGRLTILVTSRIALRIQGEREYPVPPLEVPAGDEPFADVKKSPSVQLFVDRARAVYPDFELTPDNGGAVAEIVAGLDGLPLAIELAAARSKLLDPKTMLERLSAVLDLAAGSGREVPDRQRTLRGTIQWSYDLLDSTARAVLQDFAVFRGGASFEAIEAVCAAPDVAMIDELEKLMDHSLIRRIDTPTGPRLVVLETIREFAAERLVAAQRVEAIRDNHLEFFLGLSETTSPGLTTEAQGDALETLAADRENLARALEWAIETGRTNTAARMVNALWRFWHMRGPLSTGRALAEHVLELDGASAQERYLALEAAGGLAYWQADLAAAESHYAESVTVAESLGDNTLLSNALYNLSFPVSFLGRVDEARHQLDRALPLAEAEEDRLTVGKILWAQGDAAFTDRDWEHAREHFEKAILELVELDDMFMKGWAHRMLGTTLLELGETDRAREHLEQGLAIFGPAGDLSGIVFHLLDFARLARIEGHNERAVILLGAALGQEQRGGTGLVLAGPNDPTLVEEALAAVDQADVERLTERGRAMSVEDAITFALEKDE